MIRLYNQECNQGEKFGANAPIWLAESASFHGMIGLRYENLDATVVAPMVTSLIIIKDRVGYINKLMDLSSLLTLIYLKTRIFMNSFCP